MKRPPSRALKDSINVSMLSSSSGKSLERRALQRAPRNALFLRIPRVNLKIVRPIFDWERREFLQTENNFVFLNGKNSGACGAARL